MQFGEFRLAPMTLDLAAQADQILPFASPAKRALPGYLLLSMSSVWDPKLFDLFPDADSCLVIHKPEEFGERIHRAAQRLLPSWAGIDAAASYGVPSPLGAAFSRDKQRAAEKEWLFAWRPTQPSLPSNPIIIQIGNIESIAELRDKGG